jgi:hypothetical protein
MIMLAKEETERFPSLRDVSKALISLLPRRSQAAERQAIIAALAADALRPPVAELPQATTASPQAVVPLSELVPPADATTVPIAPGTGAAQTQATAPVSSVAGGEVQPPPARPGKRLAAVVAVAVLLLVAIGYAIATRSGGPKTISSTAQPAQTGRADAAAASKPTDTVAATKPETTISARVDVAPPPKPETTAKAPAVADSKASTSGAKTPAPKTAEKRAKRDSVGQARPDSVAARCAALNLKFSLGEEVTKADSAFLRTECAKLRSRGSGL